MSGAGEPVLRVNDLTVAYRHGRRWAPAVREVSLRIAPGQIYGLVGESGSGKTTLALAVMRYLPPEGRVHSGTIHFGGRDLLGLEEAQMRPLWGRELNLVPQDPLSALNPSLRIGEQVGEAIRRRPGQAGAAVQGETLAWLERVRLADAARVAASFPHQISGGMQQRVLIAMALSTHPRLLVLDEPTTGLDVTTEAAVLDLLRELMRANETAALYVTHNLGVVAALCERVAVLYAGELVEDGPVSDIYRQPLHPYTRGLIDSIPRLGMRKGSARLTGLAGQIAAGGEELTACVYAPRCPLGIEVCFRERPPLEAAPSGRQVRCHRWREIAAGEVTAAASAGEQLIVPNGKGAPAAVAADPVLNARKLEVAFPMAWTVSQVLGREPRRILKAVERASFNLTRGETLGLVGESGAGKSTIARAVVGLERPTGGELELNGVPLRRTVGARSRDVLKRIQWVAQNPQEALNPYVTIGETLRRPLMRLGNLGPREADEGVRRLLEAVRLPAAYMERLPSQLSGGEKQRAAIARAFAAAPDLLVADEPVSALDVSVQASILNLLNDFQRVQDTAVLFISHDMAVVGYMADTVAVLYLGQLMELGPTDAVLKPPYHPYTEALLAAVPVPDPDRQAPSTRLEGDIPSPVDRPSGCPFHTRCPRFLGRVCVEQDPPWRSAPGGKHYYCHIPVEQLLGEQAQEAT